MDGTLSKLEYKPLLIHCLELHLLPSLPDQGALHIVISPLSLSLTLYIELLLEGSARGVVETTDNR